MFCPNCGMNNPDGAAHCSNCGTMLTQPQQPNYAQPQQPFYGQPQPAQAGFYQNYIKPVAVSKSEFIKTLASSSTKMLAKVVWALGAILVLLAILGANSAVNGSILEIPLIKTAVSSDELDQLDEEWDEMIDEMDHLSDEQIEEAEKVFDMDIKDIKNALDNCSLNSMRTIGAAISDGDNFWEEFDQDLFNVFNGIIVVIWIYAGIICIFALLSAIFRNRALFIVGMIFSTGFYLALAGAVYFFLALIVTIAAVVIISIISNEYKSYKRGLGIY